MGIPPFQPVLLPAIFTMAPGATHLSALRIRPIPLTADRLDALPGRSDPAAWISHMLAPHLGSARLTSRVHPMLPRMTRFGQLGIPVWATARAPGFEEAVDPHFALDELGGELGDPRFASHVMATVRAALATEPFAQRIVGEDLRMLALKEDRLSSDPTGDRPTVIALLPETFTLNELQQAIAATLGIHPDEMESSSNFRRRLQEFVHRGVLEEAPSPRDAAPAERAGRPPRHYRFEPTEWRRWLREHRSRGSREASGMPEPVIRMYASPPPPAMSPSPPPDGWADARLSKLERMMRELEEKLGGERDGTQKS